MDVNPKSRRKHIDTALSSRHKLTACAEPGATVAAVARAFGLNDNLVHDWWRGRNGAGASKTIGTSLQESPPEFVALSLPFSLPSPSPAPTPAIAPEGIRLEFKRAFAAHALLDSASREHRTVELHLVVGQPWSEGTIRSAAQLVRESAASSMLETISKTGRLAMRYATISPL